MREISLNYNLTWRQKQFMAFSVILLAFYGIQIFTDVSFDYRNPFGDVEGLKSHSDC